MKKPNPFGIYPKFRVSKKNKNIKTMFFPPIGKFQFFMIIWRSSWLSFAFQVFNYLFIAIFVVVNNKEIAVLVGLFFQ